MLFLTPRSAASMPIGLALSDDIQFFLYQSAPNQRQVLKEYFVVVLNRHSGLRACAKRGIGRRAQCQNHRLGRLFERVVGYLDHHPARGAAGWNEKRMAGQPVVARRIGGAADSEWHADWLIGHAA